MDNGIQISSEVRGLYNVHHSDMDDEDIRSH